MNIQIQICGIALLLILISLYAGQRKNKAGTSQIFKYMMITAICSSVINLVNVFIMQGTKSFTEFSQILSKLYCIMVISTCALSFIYFTMELCVTAKLIAFLKKITALFYSASILAELMLDIHAAYSPEENCFFYYGYAMNCMYQVCGIFMFLNVIALCLYRKYYDRRRWDSALMWITIWICAAFVQIKFHTPLLEFAGAIGINLLYLKIESPEGKLDKESGFFNEQSFVNDISYLYSHDKMSDTHILVMQVDKHTFFDNSIDRNQRMLLIKELAAFIDTLGAQAVYKSIGMRFTMIYDNLFNMKLASKSIQDRFLKSHDISELSRKIKPLLFEIPNCSWFRNSEDFLETYELFINEAVLSRNSKVYEFDDEWAARLRKFKAMSKEITDALNEDRIKVFYQPIYSIAQKKYVSAEALVRIEGKDGKLIMPGEFIGVAEQTGQIAELGLAVFRKACQFIKNSHLKEKGINYLEINLSAVQCVRDELADQYIKIMEELEIDPGMINLEITESAALSSKETLLENMNRLIDYGVEFSLDDFGTGYSNLNYIMELPVSIVKFDRQMTNSYFESEKGKLIMEAAIGMIKAVGTKIVSEGVETQNQFDILEQVCIDFIQGYYFSKPVCEEEFLKLLENENAA